MSWVQPAWLTETVVNLARQIIKDRSWSVLPILADALQDAGCDDELRLNLLRHHYLDPSCCRIALEVSNLNDAERFCLLAFGFIPAKSETKPSESNGVVQGSVE